MTLAYDGTGYRGWQAQAEGDTIQGLVERVLTRMAKAPVRVVGAGRTDAGVHAREQVAHFTLERAIEPEGLKRGSNTLLPQDIRVLSVSEAAPDFHARFSATAKTYHYRLDRSDVHLPFRSRFSLHYPHALDLGALDEAAKVLVGEHDFEAFRASACSAKGSIRRVFESSFHRDDPELVYEVRANGFLHHMARNFIGTLLEVGRGKRSAQSLAGLIESKDRRLAGPTAPAKGLHLMQVEYP